ncbi:50S ribosomal protein L4 [Nocardioides speluncae]|uniref:50S ribosomal protein L4, sunset domain variant n=1 Tax=Nocardioides speluncae TaxID=2670337 RepID=UPI000D692D32|nr:50S ribosomal protein L4 [Nocardioides speluncae]
MSRSVTNLVKVDLPAEIFDVEVNVPLMHQVVVAQQAAARQGSASTKTQAEVRGGGRKPYKQKGTGRARQGSIRAPQFTGGGVVHGPKPRSYDQRTPKKMKAAALKAALSDRARNDRIHVVESLVTGEKPSTKAAIASLQALSERRRFLVVLERGDNLTWLSLRNAPEVHIIAVDQLNTYDVLAADEVVFTKAAYDVLVGGKSEGETVPVETTKKPAKKAAAKVETESKSEEKPKAKAKAEPKAIADVPAEEAPKAELPKGAKAPLKSGGAPKGYEVKGNADSGLYHEPDGQWYDATVAEFYFKSAEAAEAAGFKRAGSSEEGDK